MLGLLYALCTTIAHTKRAVYEKTIALVCTEWEIGPGAEYMRLYRTMLAHGKHTSYDKNEMRTKRKIGCSRTIRDRPYIRISVPLQLPNVVVQLWQTDRAPIWAPAIFRQMQNNVNVDRTIIRTHITKPENFGRTYKRKMIYLYFKSIPFVTRAQKQLNIFEETQSSCS